MDTPEVVLGRVTTVLAGYPGAWWVGGGWAIDAFLGRVTREHHDTDIAVLRADAGRLRAHLAGWTIWINEPGRFVPWTGRPLLADDACLMARPADGRELSWDELAAHPATLEVMLEESEAGDWVYRRDRRVRDSLDRLGAPGGFIAPEVALLYKAPQHEVERNAADFEVVVDELAPDSRRWLAGALRVAHPGHPWIEPLEYRV